MTKPHLRPPPFTGSHTKPHQNPGHAPAHLAKAKAEQGTPDAPPDADAGALRPSTCLRCRDQSMHSTAWHLRPSNPSQTLLVAQPPAQGAPPPGIASTWCAHHPRRTAAIRNTALRFAPRAGMPQPVEKRPQPRAHQIDHHRHRPGHSPPVPP